MNNLRDRAADNHLPKGTRRAAMREAITCKPRIPLPDRQIFARNLGELAMKVCQEKPLDGARQIVEKAGRLDLWPEKRKKYFLFREENPVKLAADGSVFVQMSDAAAAILSSTNMTQADRIKDNCLAKLAAGSSFYPDYEPIAGLEGSAYEMLQEYAQGVSQAIEKRTDLPALWKVIKETPIYIAANFLDDTAQGPEGNRLPSSLGEIISSQLRSGRAAIGDLTTNAKAGCDVLLKGWVHPRIYIGMLGLKVTLSHIPIDSASAPLFACEPGAEFHLNEEAKSWMRKMGFSGIHEENDEYIFPDGSNQNYKSIGVYLWYRTYLLIDDASGKPILKLQFSEYDLLSSYNMDTVKYFNGDETFLWELCNFEREIDASFGEDNAFHVIYKTDFDPKTESFNRGPALGLVTEDWLSGFTGDSGCTEGNQKASDLIIGMQLGEHDQWLVPEDEWDAPEFLTGRGVSYVFYPNFPQDEEAPPLMQDGTIAAALLKNCFVVDQKVTDQLISRAEAIAKLGLEHYEGIVNRYRQALLKI